MKRSTALLILATAIAVIYSSLATGCSIVGMGGAMIDSYRRQSTRSVDAEYKGLEGQRWAVVVAADRIIQADYPHIVPHLNARITERLLQQQQQIAATGYVPAESVLAFQYENPRWIAMPRGELARQLGVDRLIYIELLEYRLHDPGNQYLWAGVAVGTIGVVEVNSPVPDEFIFEQSVRVSFPDGSSFGPGDIPRDVVAAALAGRFIDRASWLFYRHDEPYYPKY